MGLQVADLSAKLGLDTSAFDRGISGIPGKFNPIGGAALGASAIAVGAVAAIGVAAFKMGAEFDDAYDSIRIGTGATGARLDGLKDSFKDVVTDVPASFGDASSAITGLNQRLGITGPRLVELSDQFLELSRITGTEVADDVRLGTRLFGDWSIKTGQQADTLDQLFRATQQSGIGLSDLMTTVVQFGAPLRNMGFSFSDSIAMLSKWEKEGVNITTVLAGMRMALKTFSKEGIDPAKGFAKAVDDITKAKSRAAAMKIGTDIFGLRGASDTVAAIREGRFQYQKFADVIAKGSDTIHTAAKDTEDLDEAWNKMYNTIKVKAEPVLSGFFDMVSEAFKDPGGTKYAASVDRIQEAAGKLARLPNQTGWAAFRTGKIIEDLTEIMKTPLLLGDVNAKHTQGQLKDIRADIIHQLGITVQEADALMALMFKDWNPKKPLNAKLNPAIAGAEARVADLTATLIRNRAFGKFDNGPLVDKIAAAQAKLEKLQAKVRAQIAAGKLETYNWTHGIGQAQHKFDLWKISVGGAITVGNLIAPPMPKGDYSGGAADVGGAGYGWASALAGNFGLSVSSTYRPGAITAAGNVSDHGTFGRAADIAGPDSAMNRLWAYVKSTPGSWKQAIHEHQILNYGSLGSYGPSDHFDHVHLARMALGGITKGISIAGELGPNHPEAVIPLTNPRRGAQVMAEAGLLGGGGSTVINVTVPINAPVYGVDDLCSIVHDGTMAAMEEAQVAEGRSRRGSVR